jgi:3-deoxy-D-manno-octulosonate 8-phosphate phosphatase KdsC-like HAD superfamily phosphatase
MEGRILTDPDLFKDDKQEELQTIRKKNLKIKFLEQENQNLRTRISDLEKTVMINKEIIGALVDSTLDKEYKTTF